MTRNISRKDFLSKIGMIPSGMSEPGNVISDEVDNKMNNEPEENDMKARKNPYIRRGSWIRSGNTKEGDIILVKDGRGCEIILDENENTAVKQAATFLAGDIKKISGYQPPIKLSGSAHSTPDPQYPGATTTIRLVTVNTASLPENNIDISDIKDKWEAHKIITTGNTVWLIGADFRGTAFAAYTFCERIGIDPLYIWTGYEPEQQKTLTIKRIDYLSPSPTFKYRGFFHDDEDILPRPFERSGYPLRIGDISLVWYKRYFETALRLGMNMVAPYTRVHRRYEVQQCASEWGLFYTSHHYDILLSNPFGFDIFKLAEKRNIKPEWDWFTNKQGMIDYWKAGVWENKKLNCIWPVGLRGLGDRAYTFAKDKTEKEQSEVFNHVIATQVGTVKELLPCEPAPVCAFTLYREMYEKYDQGKEFFDLPKDVLIIWSDNNVGVMDRLPKAQGKWKHGVYYHLAVTGFDLTTQSTHIVSPYTIAEEFKKVMKSGATEYLLINISEMREFLMEARLLADISRNADAVLQKSNPAGEYIGWWCNEYFGNKSIKYASRVYEGYYKLLPHSVSIWYASDMIMALLKQLKIKFSHKAYQLMGKKDISMLESRNREYQLVMEHYWKAVSDMSPEQGQYFFENTKLGLSFDWRPTQAALLLNKALEEQNNDKAWEFVKQSIKPLEKLELEILRAERPPFHNWYRETWIRRTLSNHNVHRPYHVVRAFISSRGQDYITGVRSDVGANIPQYQAWSDFLDGQNQ